MMSRAYSSVGTMTKHPSFQHSELFPLFWGTVASCRLKVGRKSREQDVAWVHPSNVVSWFWRSLTPSCISHFELVRERRQRLVDSRTHAGARRPKCRGPDTTRMEIK